MDIKKEGSNHHSAIVARIGIFLCGGGYCRLPSCRHPPSPPGRSSSGPPAVEVRRAHRPGPQSERDARPSGPDQAPTATQADSGRLRLTQADSDFLGTVGGVPTQADSDFFRHKFSICGGGKIFVAKFDEAFAKTVKGPAIRMLQAIVFFRHKQYFFFEF